MLYFIMRPDNVIEPDAVFTRFGGLTQNLERCKARAERCLGRVYANDGHNVHLVADFYVEPMPAPKLVKRAYWSARNQAACFA